MNKEKYMKPVLDVLELNDDIVLASGCVDIACMDICDGLTCDPHDPNCGDVCPCD